MTPKDIEIFAHDNRPMPEFSALTDICLYQAFANLYNRLNLKQIVRDQAKTEKKQILKTYAQIKSENERYIAVCGEYQDNIRKAGTLLSDIEKSQDIREIALKSCECIGIMTDDSRIDLLNRETGDTLSTVDMWKAVTADYFLGRGAWIFVNSNGINVESLHYVDCNNISILTNNDPIFKAFTVQVNERKFYDFQFMKFLRRTKDGFTNIPLQADNSKILSAAYNSLKLEKMMSANGGCKPGFLKAKTKLSKESVEYIKEAYPEVYGNSDSDKKIIVLNEGIEFEPISSTAAELQMNENKKVNSVEICKLFGFPHTIIDGGASETDKREFVSAVINFLNQIETELDRCLLLESEKEDGYYWAFDTKELTRGSILERYQAYEIALRNRFLQVDEIRQAEDYDPIGFNFVTLGLGDVLLNPETMEIFTPNTGQMSNLETGESRALPLELRYNKNHDSKGRFSSGRGGGAKKGLTKKSSGAKMSKKERKLVVSEINTYYDKRFKGKKVGYYYSGTYSKKYEFEIDGFNKYRFINSKKIK